MTEYINKEVLLDRLDIKNALGGHYGISLTEINKIPAADVRPVEHGVWIKIKYRSICRDCSFRGFANWKYCPNCGRQMTTEGDNG